jgi:thymidylate synthase (FAD)
MAVVQAAREAHQWATSNGIAKEQARAVLPEGNTESVMIMSGSLRSWIHYCQLRLDKATQKEHRAIAQQCWWIIGAHFPDVVKGLQGIKEWDEFVSKLP